MARPAPHGVDLSGSAEMVEAWVASIVGLSFAAWLLARGRAGSGRDSPADNGTATDGVAASGGSDPTSFDDNGASADGGCEGGGGGD
jgi:hypothetical protein